MRGSSRLVVAIGALASTVMGQAPGAGKAADPGALCPPCLHDQVLQGLPASVEAIAAINNGAKQRSSPAGRALIKAVQWSGAWAETIRSWEQLSKTLDWAPDKAFDEVLGRRTSLVVRGLGSPEGPDWVVLTAVSEATQRRLRERLKTVPRGAVCGMSVMSIEDGSFQLLVAPCPEAGSRGEEGSVVLLAPRRSEALMDEIAPSLRIRSLAMPVATSQACDVVIAVRPAGSTERTLSVTATFTGTGWDAAVACEPGLVLGNGKQVGSVTPWRDSLFKELETGSLLAVMSVVGADQMVFLPEQVASWKRLLAGLTKDAADDRGALRTGLFVRAVGPAPVAAPDRAAALRVSTDAVGHAEGPRGRLAVCLLSESREPRATLVKGDLAMARVARTIMTGEAEPGPEATQIRFEVPSSGPRSLVLGEELTVHGSLEAGLVRAFGEQARLSWDMVDRRDGTAWWVASLSPGDAPQVREARALMAHEAGESRRRLSVGSVRPAALERWVLAVEPEAAGAFEGARFVESIRWDAWLRDDGRVGATVNIRMMPAGQR